MAVPARRNGEEEEEEDEGLFEEEGEGWADLDSDVPPHLRALADAAQHGDVEALRVALEFNTKLLSSPKSQLHNKKASYQDNHTGSIDDPVEDGDTVLHLCCLYGCLPCVRLLVERGASLESKDEDGAIPLHDACAGGYVEIVQFIINSAGNDGFVKRMLDTTDAEGDTPLHHAARGEHLDVVHLLLSVGASPKKRNVYEKIPAELAEPGLVRSTLEAAAATDSVACH